MGSLVGFALRNVGGMVYYREGPRLYNVSGSGSGLDVVFDGVATEARLLTQDRHWP